MNLSFNEQKELKNIINKVNSILNKNYQLNNLYEKKRQTIKYLTLMLNTKENKKLIDKYNKLDLELKKIEQRATYIITKEEKENTVIKKTFFNEKKIKKLYSAQQYDEKFNFLLKKTAYTDIMRKRSKIFRTLIKINNEDSSALYRLDSIETEISIMETDALRDYILKN